MLPSGEPLAADMALGGALTADGMLTLAGLAVCALVRRAHGGGVRPGSRARGEVMAVTRPLRPDAAHDSLRALFPRPCAWRAPPARRCIPSAAWQSRSCPAGSTLVTRWDPALGADRPRPVPRRPHAAHVRYRLRARRGRGARCRAPANLTAVPAGAVVAKLLALEAPRRGRAGRGARRVQGPCSPSPGACRSCSACGRLAGIVLGSLPLYALGLGVALRLGRNAAISAGGGGDASRSSQWADLRTASRPASYRCPWRRP